MMFPPLRRADARLGPVVDRLAEEHEVIADVLNRVDAALVALVGRPTGSTTSGTRWTCSVTLLSHLSYEERELVEPLARLGLALG
jgi:hypothetical protein